MTSKVQNRNVIALIRSSVGTLFANPLIFYPFCIIIFIQLLAVEIIYFSPRFPLVLFFGPVIKRLWSEAFLHYPLNLVLLPKLFQYAQMVIFLFVSSFLTGVAVAIIAAINSDRTVSYKSAVRQVGRQYVHVVFAAFITFLAYMGFSNLYGLVIQRAAQIKSTAGIYFMIKKLVMVSVPYVNLLIGVLVSTLFAFVIIIIVVEKKKVIQAFILNFKNIWRSFWFLLMVILLPTLLYIPVLLLRNYMAVMAEGTFPGLRVAGIVLSIFVMAIIDAIVYTSLTTYYLLKQENK